MLIITTKDINPVTHNVKYIIWHKVWCKISNLLSDQIKIQLYDGVYIQSHNTIWAPVAGLLYDNIITKRY